MAAQDEPPVGPMGVGEARSSSTTASAEVSLIRPCWLNWWRPPLMVVGWKTRWAALPAAFTMGVAAFVVHGGDPIGDKELALLYLVCFAAVAALGGGRWSLDAALDKR